MKIFKILPVIAFTTLSMQTGANLNYDGNIVENRSDRVIIEKLDDIVQNKLPENFSEVTVKKKTSFVEIENILDDKVRQLIKQYPDFHINFSIEEIINRIEPGREEEIEYLIAFFEIFSIQHSHISLSVKQFRINIKYLD